MASVGSLSDAELSSVTHVNLTKLRLFLYNYRKHFQKKILGLTSLISKTYMVWKCDMECNGMKWHGIYI